MLHTNRIFTLLSLIIIFLLPAGSGMLNPLSAQETDQKLKIYKAWVSVNNEPSGYRGAFYRIGDSTILISSSMVKQDYLIDNFSTVELHIDNVQEIKLRRKNSVIKWAGIGAISGLVAGAAIGFASGDDTACGDWWCFTFRAEAKATLLGVGGFFTGAWIGAAIGAVRVKIPINGSQSRYEGQKKELQNYSFQ